MEVEELLCKGAGSCEVELVGCVPSMDTTCDTICCFGGAKMEGLPAVGFALTEDGNRAPAGGGAVTGIGGLTSPSGGLVIATED